MSNEIIKRATAGEKGKIINFLNENWGADHPLVNNDIFFNYYYLDPLDENHINFYYLEEDFEIAAICGYIKCAQYVEGGIWVSIWCAKKGKNGLGLALMGEVQKLTGAKVISCNNIRKNTMPFYTFLGYYPSKLEHYYRLNDLEKYNIAAIASKEISLYKKAENTYLKLFDNAADIDKAFIIPSFVKPRKDFWYIEKRYIACPFYNYNIYGVYKDDSCVALVVFRINHGEEGKVLRLVDYIGNPQDFGLLSGHIDDLTKAFDCEYCDMYSYGVDGKAAGFTLREDEDKNIIPNYLNPLLQENIDYFFFTSDKENFMMFKADGDQDRKNIK